MFALTALINRYTLSSRKVALKEQLIIGYGGLRGAIAFSLAFMLEPDHIEGRNTFLGATYFVILFTG